MILAVYINKDTELRLQAIAAERGDDIEELASAAVEEEALAYFRDRDFVGDPTRQSSQEETDELRK